MRAHIDDYSNGKEALVDYFTHKTKLVRDTSWPN